MTSAPPVNRPVQRRRLPRQQRSQETVHCILVAAARVFRAEGFAATTNRIAAVAGVSIGTLYEYFPNKQALLLALAEAHVQTAESALHAALHAALQRSSSRTPRECLADVQRAILQCHAYPSQAIELVDNQTVASDLRQRASRLRQQVLDCFTELAGDAEDAALRSRAAFFALAELAARALYEHSDPAAHARMAELGLDMALRALVPKESVAPR